MKTVLRSNNLSCPSCVSKIERALNALEGVSSAKVHFTTGRIEIHHDGAVRPETLVRAVNASGYDARLSAF